LFHDCAFLDKVKSLEEYIGVSARDIFARMETNVLDSQIERCLQEMQLRAWVFLKPVRAQAEGGHPLISVMSYCLSFYQAKFELKLQKNDYDRK
jgi:hypothetical protein